MDTPMMNSAKISSRGQITIPKHIRKKMNLKAGEKVYLIPEGGKYVLSNTPENPIAAAMREWQEAMKGKWEEAGIHTEEDIMKLVKEVRYEIEGIK